MRHHFSTITNRPEPCRAKEGNCRYAEHSDSPQELIDAHEKRMETSFAPTVLKKSPKTITYAPPRPETPPLTLEEVQEGLSRVYDSKSKVDYRHVREARRNVVGFGLTGSIAYGLNTESSDRDILVFTENYDVISIHKEYKDGLDMKLNSLGHLMRSIQDGSYSEIDLINSKEMKFVGHYERFIKGMRFNPYLYYKTSRSHIVNTIVYDQQPEKGTRDREREEKSIKVSLRNAFLMKRVREYNQLYTPYFNDEEREQFYKEYHGILEFRSNPEVTKKDVIERILQVSQEDGL